MKKVKLNKDDIMIMSAFEEMSGANVLDCISDEERVVFIVKEGDIGAAIGKGGENVKKATEKFGKKIDVIEYSDDVKTFVRNIFAPVKLDDVWIKKYGDDLVVFVRIHPKFRKTVIGDKGKNINRAVMIAKRLSEINNIRVIAEERKDIKDRREGRERGDRRDRRNRKNKEGIRDRENEKGGEKEGRKGGERRRRVRRRPKSEKTENKKEVEKTEKQKITENTTSENNNLNESNESAECVNTDNNEQ